MTAAKQIEHEPQNEIAVVKQSSDVAAPSSGGTVLSMLQAVISRPDIPVEKVEQLFELQLRVEANEAKKAYTSAFAEMQPELPIIPKHGEIKNKFGAVQSTHALWEDVVELITPVLAKHGFGLSFRPKILDGKISVVAILSHREGHCEQTDPYLLPADTSGSKNAVQAIGSSTSYGKRYTAFAILNIVARGEDDDGKKGGTPPAHSDAPEETDAGPVDSGIDVISAAQADAIHLLIKNSGADLKKFLACAKAETVSDILANDFDRLAGLLRKKIEMQGAAH